MENIEKLKAEAAKSLNCLYIAVSEEIADDVNAKVRAYVNALAADSETMASDKERLDWLQENQVCVSISCGDDQNGEPSRFLWQCDSVGIDKARDNIREAIDTAMEAMATCKACGCKRDADGCGCNPHDA